MADSFFDIRKYLLQNLLKSKVMKGYNVVEIDELDLSKLEFVGGSFTYGQLTRQDAEPMSVDSLTRVNNTSFDQEQRLTRTYETSASLSWSVTKGMTNTITAGITVGPPKGMWNINLEDKLELSCSRTDSQSKSQTQSWSLDTTIRTPAHKMTITDIMIRTAHFSGPFTFQGELKGVINFISWCVVGEVGFSHTENIVDCIPGMPAVPELAIINGRLIFNGGGLFTSSSGVDTNTTTTEYAASAIRAASDVRKGD